MVGLVCLYLLSVEPRQCRCFTLAAMFHGQERHRNGRPTR